MHEQTKTFHCISLSVYRVSGVICTI